MGEEEKQTERGGGGPLYVHCRQSFFICPPFSLSLSLSLSLFPAHFFIFCLSRIFPALSLSFFCYRRQKIGEREGETGSFVKLSTACAAAAAGSVGGIAWAFWRLPAFGSIPAARILISPPPLLPPFLHLSYCQADRCKEGKGRRQNSQ